MDQLVVEEGHGSVNFRRGVTVQWVLKEVSLLSELYNRFHC